MSTEVSLLVELGIIAGSALALSLVAWALRLPAVLGQLIAGMIIGPFGLKLVTDSATIGAMAEVGIVLLLFIIGLELDLFEMIATGLKVAVFSLAEIMISFIGGLLAGFLLGWPFTECIILAAVVSISSTALVAKTLYERGALTETSARTMMGALIMEDILAVLIMSLLPGFAAGGSLTLFAIASWIMRGALLFVLILVVGVYLAPRIIDRISQLDLDVDEAGFLLSLSLGFAMAVLSSALGFSGATGAFLMGLFITGKRAKFVYGKIRPIRDLFLVVFFVTMGMLVDPSEFLNLTVVVPVVGLALAGKYVGCYAGAVLSGLRRDARNMGTDMTARGEFSFVIAREAVSGGIVRVIVYPIAGTVVLTTILVSALLRIPRDKTRRTIMRAHTDSGDLV